MIGAQREHTHDPIQSKLTYARSRARETYCYLYSNLVTSVGSDRQTRCGGTQT